MKTKDLSRAPLLGDAGIDHAHQAQFDALAALADLDAAAFGPACQTLFDALERDFRDEEMRMEGAQWNGLPAHREQHARVLGGLHHAMSALDQGDCAPARRAVLLLPQWLQLHIATFDADMLAACPHATDPFSLANKEASMFKHILIPTDGSPGGQAAIASAIRFAASCGARVTGVYAIPEFHVLTGHAAMLEETRTSYMVASNVHAADVLAAISSLADTFRVQCETVTRVSDQPHAAILDVAHERGCDLIAMASHGYKGIKGLMLGSETHKVLVHGDIPVLVFRAEPAPAA